MYKDYRDMSKPDIVIHFKSYEQMCAGFPTVYKFTDVDGDQYTFYLRHGHAEIGFDDGTVEGKTIIFGDMDGYDGVCGWEDVVSWAKSNRIEISEQK